MYQTRKSTRFRIAKNRLSKNGKRERPPDSKGVGAKTQQSGAPHSAPYGSDRRRDETFSNDLNVIDIAPAGWHKSTVEEIRHLLGALQPDLLKYASAFGLSKSDAEDVVGDVNYKILRSGTIPRNLSAFAYKAVRHRFYDLLRSRSNKPETALDGPELICWVLDSFVELEAEERRIAVVQEALSSLSADEREVIEKLFFLGETLAEVAEAYECTITDIWRLKKKLLGALLGQITKLDEGQVI